MLDVKIIKGGEPRDMTRTQIKLPRRDKMADKMQMQMR